MPPRKERRPVPKEWCEEEGCSEKATAEFMGECLCDTHQFQYATTATNGQTFSLEMTITIDVLGRDMLG